MDWTQIVTAALAFVGTLTGVLVGNKEFKKSIEQRLGRIEGKIDSHNNFGERLKGVETGLENVCQRVDRLEDR